MLPKPSTSDLILRKTSDELPTLWIAEKYLLQLLPSLSADYLRVRARPLYLKSVMPCHRKKVFLPDTNAAWRWGRINGQFYYSYHNIPDKAPAMYQSHLPSFKTLVATMEEVKKAADAQPLESVLTNGLEHHYTNFLYLYADCTKHQRIELAKAAAAVSGAVEYIGANNIPLDKNDFFLKFTELLKKHDVKYVCKSRRFKEDIILPALQGTPLNQLIKLPRANNSNASSHCDDPEIESWVIEMRKNGRNYTNEHIIRKVQLMCTLSEKPMPSRRWLGGIMEQHLVKRLTAPERFGDKGRFGNIYRGSIPLANAVHAGDCWLVDGSRFNIIDFKFKTNIDGKEATKNAFLYIVAVRDAHSGDIIGYSFDISENRWTVHTAIANAVEHTGYLPYEIRFDKFPGHNTSEMINFLDDLRHRGVKVTFTHKATAKQHIERWFRTLQEVFMQDSDYYYGEGVMSRNRYAHRSKEYLKKIRQEAAKSGWNYDTAVAEASKIIESYRNTALSYYSRKFKTIDLSPAQLQQQSETPNAIPLEDHSITYLFGLRKDLQITREGLITTDINKVPFIFRVTDPAVIETQPRVTVCYTLEDMSQVHLYEISNKALKRYLGTAKELDAVQTFGPDAEWGKLQQEKAIVHSLEERRREQLQYKLAAGSGILPLLQGGTIAKGDYEAAESEYLSQNFNTTTFNNSDHSDADDWGDDDIRNRY